MILDYLEKNIKINEEKIENYNLAVEKVSRLEEKLENAKNCVLDFGDMQKTISEIEEIKGYIVELSPKEETETEKNANDVNLIA